MKKNNMFRIASVLLVAVLLSTCAISGAFAKYTTSDTDTDSARVAKWGINVDVSAGAFSSTYVVEDEGADLDLENSVIAAEIDTVIDDVVAPGTGAAIGSVAVTGEAEVAVRVTKTFALNVANWTVPSGNEDNLETEDVNESELFYCPIQIKVGDSTFKGLDYASAAAFMAAVNGQLSSVKEYDAGYDFDDANDVDATYEWVWDFGPINGTVTNQTDVNDTVLGRLLADDDATNDPSISITVTVTVDQID